MYSIRKSELDGMPIYQITFSGFIRVEEMMRWFDDSALILDRRSEEFGVKVDMRELLPLPDHSQEIMRQGQMLYREAGMVRSAVLVDNGLLKRQFERIAGESGIDEWEHYFSSDDRFHDRNMNMWLKEARLVQSI
ncbi:MAG: hypothetical protein GY835_13190 [bacterium]|nr:hypothetical protein [bacterium]